MAEFGHYTLCLAWILSVTGMVVALVSARSSTNAWIKSAVSTSTMSALCSVISICCLATLFVQDDYSIQYVWQYSNRDMPWIYKITAIWGGMDGSMLLWSVLLSIFCAFALGNYGNYPRKLTPWLVFFLNSTTTFFLSVTLFLTNPYRFLKAPYIPPDGNGLNPLLQNEYMAIHPPMLYLGFTALAVPYALCMAALASGVTGNEWIRHTRKWALIGWTFLTAGIVLGGHWAYLELGWGGFWAWDPVENSSFLPWLIATALVHSIMVQSRKGMLKVWNISLAVLSYGLTVFGTFLTRSGVVQSVHAFASTDIGWIFLAYLSLIVLTTIGLLALRWSELKPERRIESVFSREAAFLVNNLLLLSICFAVLWGVMFPVLSEALTGTKQNLGIPFFNTVTIPLFMLLIFVMGVGPVIAWRKSSASQMKRSLALPFISAFAVGVLLVWAGVTDFYPLLSYCLCFFVLMTILGELNRGMKAQRAIVSKESGSAIGGLLRRHRIKYGGHLIHFGVLVMVISITASMSQKMEKEFSLAPGEETQLGRFSFQLQDYHEVNTANYEGVQAQVAVRRIKDGSDDVTLFPEMRFYRRKQETTTEVALRMGPREDLYVVLAGLDDAGQKATLKVFINPLQIWLWFGAIIMVIGGIIVAIPERLGATKLAALDRRNVTGSLPTV